jgi:hypothetical protein
MARYLSVSRGLVDTTRYRYEANEVAEVGRAVER